MRLLSFLLADPEARPTSIGAGTLSDKAVEVSSVAHSVHAVIRGETIRLVSCTYV